MSGKISKKYWYRKFYYAFKGIFSSLREEKSMIVHVIISLLVIVFSFGIKISISSWPIIVLVIGLVISLELINTAIENLVDMVSFKYNINARKVKDISAAATLIVSIVAITIALLIFIPRIMEIVRYGY